METTEAPLRTAKSTPASKSLRLFEGASTRRILACGAMACAHSISSEISTAQLALAAGVRPPGYSWGEEPLSGGAGCQVELLAENGEVVGCVGIVISVHERDGLAGALVGDEIKTVGMANLRR